MLIPAREAVRRGWGINFSLPPGCCFSLLRGRGAGDVTPPGLPSQKTARVVWGVYFLTVPPSWGVVPPGVVFGVAQNGTVGCEKVHFRRVGIVAVESAPGLPTKRLARLLVHPESA